MDEASSLPKSLFARLKSSRPRLRRQAGQAIVEYILILILAIGFTRFVFFNKEFGAKAMIDKTMLKLGSFLEQNLKTGTKTGADGVKSLEAFGGTSRWSN